jgi:hypothetical protein
VDYRQQAEQQEAQVSQGLREVRGQVQTREVGERVGRVVCQEHQEVREEAVALLQMALRGARGQVGQVV